MINIRGRIVDPDGKPVAGESFWPIFVGINQDIEPILEATSGQDGRFSMKGTRAIRTLDSLRSRAGVPPFVAATAPGFGPGCWNSAVA